MYIISTMTIFIEMLIETIILLFLNKMVSYNCEGISSKKFVNSLLLSILH